MTTTAFDETSRAEVWREELGAAFGGLRAEALDAPDAPDLTGHLAGTDLGRASAFRIGGTPQIVRRTRRSAATEPSDVYKVCIQQRGLAVVHQDGREVTVHPGELVLYDTARPYDLRLEGNWLCAVMTLPRDALGVPSGVISAAMDRAFRATDGPGSVLRHLVSSSVAQAMTTPASLGGEQLGEAGLQLMASLLRGPEMPQSLEDDTRREQVLAHVRGHLADPGLSHTSVAAAHGLSPRTLHRLFEHEEQTVAEAIRTLRLERIREDLADPFQAHRATMAIAAAWGYGDQAHLTRAFRRRFGTTPAAFRRQAAGG